MITLVLSSLEKAINTYLQLDPEVITQLSKLEEKIIKINITDWDMGFFILTDKEGIKLSATSKDNPDTIISGTLFGLLKTGHKGDTLSFFKNAIEIRGNIQVAENIWNIIGNIDIDWEEHLSKMTGDVIAHKVSQGVRGINKFSKLVKKTFRQNIKDYLQAESQLTPTLEEVDSFVQAVSDLQHDVDRIEMRIKRLSAKGIFPI